jgi:hypothetical protein
MFETAELGRKTSAAMSRSAGRAKRVPERQSRGWGPGALIEA